MNLLVSDFPVTLVTRGFGARRGRLRRCRSYIVGQASRRATGAVSSRV
jgi:hypothetical protein